MDYLRTYSDENHPVKLKDIAAAMTAKDIYTTRKALYDDFAALEEYGFEVIRVDNSYSYFYGNPLFEFAELKLLMDIIYASSFVSEKKSQALIDKLKTFCSIHQRGQLSRQMLTVGVKSKNESVLYNVDTINNAILKGTGQLEGVSYEEIRYEAYGVAGAAMIIDCTTDNRTRTVADVRHALTKHGGNLGTTGSVEFQFKHCGNFLFAPGTSEDKVMEVALEAGADDVVSDEDGSIEVFCDPSAFDAVQKAFEAASLEPANAEIMMKPLNEVELAGEDAEKMRRLIDALEDLDDVSNVYTSAVFADEE
jgi:YebC/PmpR family DNA-binding regulatory protein